MNTDWYVWVIENKFSLWVDIAFQTKSIISKGAKAYLVQDHERCLWTDEARDAMEDQHIELLEDFPKCSQDLNPCEIAWREVKARLNDTMPVSLETRPEFIQRLRAAVAWVNKNRAEYLLQICTSQKAWTKDVLTSSPPGFRTRH